MPITFTDSVSFPFNNGRGITPDQVDWDITDTELTTLLTTLAAAGNTSHVLTAVPVAADGADGDTAIVLVSATEVAGYSKAAGAWTQTWTFTGGGGLTAAVINALPTGDIHSNSNWPFVDANGVLSRVPFANAVAFMRSSSGLGPRINPTPSAGTVGQIPVVNEDGDAYTHALNTGFLQPGTNGQYRAATAEDVGRTIGQGHNTRIGARVIVSQTTRDVTRIHYTADNFLGVSDSQSNFNDTAEVGDFMFNNFLYLWYINTGPGLWTTAGARPDGFLNGYSTEELGDEHVRGVGDIFYVYGQSILWVVIAFVSGDTVYGYEWATPQEIINLLARNDIPDGVTDGEGVIWHNGEWAPGMLANREDSFPHVQRLPTAVEGGEELVYLEHNYSEGLRQDGTLRLATTANFTGYSRIGAQVGSISEDTPIVRIRVVANDVGLITRWDTIYFLEEDSANLFDRIRLAGTDYNLGATFGEGSQWAKRVTNGPEDTLSLDTDIDINLRYTGSADYYLTDATTVLNQSGLYELIEVVEDEYIYDAIASLRRVHTVGVGEPSTPPIRNGETYVDILGRQWNGVVTVFEDDTPASGTQALFTYHLYDRNPRDLQDLLNLGDGAFWWAPAENGSKTFNQFAFPPADLSSRINGRSLREVFTHILTTLTPGSDEHTEASAIATSEFLGGFPSLQDALDEASLIVTQEDYDGGKRIYYGLTTGLNPGIFQIDTYTRAELTRVRRGVWVGPVAFTSDLEEVLIPFDGHGSPGVAPTESHVLAINDSGDVYASEGIDVVHTAPSSWSTAPADVDWTHYKGVQRFVNSSVLTTENDFMFGASPRFWIVNDGSFSTREFNSWTELSVWYNDVAARRTGAPAGLFDSRFLAGPNLAFANDTEAALFIQSHIGWVTTIPFTYFVGAVNNFSNWTFKLAAAGAYVAGTVVHNEVDSWLARFARIDETPEVQVVANEAAAIADGDRSRVLYLFP